MKIVRIDKSNEDLFYNFVKGKELEYFFYLMDYTQYPEKTQMFLGIEEQTKEIAGLFIIWRNHTVQLRGNILAAKSFLKFLDENSIDVHSITGTSNFRELLKEKYPNPSLQFNLYRMTLNKGEQIEHKQKEYIKLDDSPLNKEKIAAFLRRADPIYFGHHKAQDIVMDENHPYFAIVQDENIISIVGLWIDKMMGIIQIIATDPDHRRKGLATAMVSTGIEWLFERTDRIIIHVRTDNVPAVHTYEKAGYQISFEYEVLDLQR